MGSGSGPPRTHVSSESKRPGPSGPRSKSTTTKFSAMRRGSTDVRITGRLCWPCRCSTTCAGVVPRADENRSRPPRLTRSEASIRCVPAGLDLQPPPLPEDVQTFDAVCARLGMDSNSQVPVPQVDVAGGEMDTVDRIQLATDIVRSVGRCRTSSRSALVPARGRRNCRHDSGGTEDAETLQALHRGQHG